MYVQFPYYYYLIFICALVQVEDYIINLCLEVTICDDLNAIFW